MELIAAALVFGLVLAVVARGSLGRILDTSVRWSTALFGAFALQIVTGLWRPGHRPAVTLFVASFALLGAFCLANLRLRGMGVVAVGVLMNGVVVLVNGGMPVRLPADAGAGSRAELRRSATHHLETDDDRLAWLGDIVPVPGRDNLLVSFGDLVLAAGVINVLFRASRRPHRRRVPGSKIVAMPDPGVDGPLPARPAAAPVTGDRWIPRSDAGRDVPLDQAFERHQDPRVVDVARG